jgi:SAM-dependent methyltransferase
MTNLGGTLADIGCGTGRAGVRLSGTFDVTLIDFAKNALDPGIDLPFIRADITRHIPGMYDYGYCCDVMEHIEPRKVDKTLKNILAACKSVFFSIHFGPDNFGRLVGHPLHLTQECFVWWRDKLKLFGELKDARDFLGYGVFYVEG